MNFTDEHDSNVHFANEGDEETACGLNPRRCDTTNSVDYVTCPECIYYIACADALANQG